MRVRLAQDAFAGRLARAQLRALERTESFVYYLGYVRGDGGIRGCQLRVAPLKKKKKHDTVPQQKHRYSSGPPPAHGLGLIDAQTLFSTRPSAHAISRAARRAPGQAMSVLLVLAERAGVGAEGDPAALKGKQRERGGGSRKTREPIPRL